ncbi:MAG: LamG-like jellyroll fold domain-containing protein [Cyanobacteriota bacterium]
MSKYKVVRKLGHNREGGRITYLATTHSTGKQVVIKEFRFAASGANWSGFKAYEREIEMLKQLQHPRIPYYLDSLETKSGFCLVQEYKNALSLAVRRSFTAEDIKQIAVSVLEILVYLQQRIPPVIHRDIKPENILVDKKLNAYLVDFGFARIRDGEFAMSSIAAGTPGFMPPEEQFGRPLTEASDLYSLGATLICLLTGTRSVDIGQLIDDDYRFDFKNLVPQLSFRFVKWLTKMVEPNLKHRYPNAAVALAALKPIQVKGSDLTFRRKAFVLGLSSLCVFVLLGTILTVFRSEKAIKVDNSSLPVPSQDLNIQEVPSPNHQAIPFHISSRENQFFAFVGTFDGEYRVYPTFIEVTIKKATIYLQDNAPYKGRRELISLKVNLGGDLPKGGWKSVNKSEPFLVSTVMKPGDTYTFTSARFLIPKTSSTDLLKHWLVVEMQSTTLDGQNAGTSRGFTYAHSKRNIFSPVYPTTSQIELMGKPSLVGYWNFDRCSNTGKPMLANQLGGQVQGARLQGVSCDRGRFGSAALFDGVDDLIEIPDQPSFHFTNQMTVTAWVKPLRVSGLQTIVNKWYARDSYMLLMENGNFVFTVAFPNGQQGIPVKVSAPATQGVWTHIAGVYDGQMLLLYINGQLAASTAASGILQDSQRPISIGNHPSWNAFQGSIDEVRLYNIALDATQVSQLLSQL